MKLNLLPKRYAKMGQGTTEYLIVLAAVIAVALVAISLGFGLFGLNANQIGTLQNKDYWNQQSIGLADATIDANGNAIFSLQNNTDYELRLIGYSVGDDQRTLSRSITFQPHQSKTVFFSKIGACDSKSDNACSYEDFFLLYTTQSGETYQSGGTALITGKSDTLTHASLADPDDWICVENQELRSCNATPGLNNNTSYWLCTAADCSTKCQVQIQNGLITGCI